MDALYIMIAMLTFLVIFSRKAVALYKELLIKEE